MSEQKMIDLSNIKLWENMEPKNIWLSYKNEYLHKKMNELFKSDRIKGIMNVKEHTSDIKIQY